MPVGAGLDSKYQKGLRVVLYSRVEMGQCVESEGEGVVGVDGGSIGRCCRAVLTVSLCSLASLGLAVAGFRCRWTSFRGLLGWMHLD